MMKSAPQKIYVYDLTESRQSDLRIPGQSAKTWDESHLIATLQGIVNRQRPQLYVRYVERNGLNIDDWWLEKLTAKGSWLEGVEIEPIGTLKELVERFGNSIGGAVVYDSKVPASSNVASTIAGVDNLVAIRKDTAPDSIFTRLVAKGPRLPVQWWLRAEDGSSLFDDADTSCGTSSECQAYSWSKQMLVDTGRCNQGIYAQYPDCGWIKNATESGPSHTVMNHDYFVAKRAFFRNPDCVAAPGDEVLELDGDHDMANGSFFMHFTNGGRDVESAIDPVSPEAGSDDDQDMVLFQIGDFGSAALLYQSLPELWEDPNRGQVPISWVLQPILSRRAPMALELMRRTRTTNDSLLVGTDPSMSAEEDNGEAEETVEASSCYAGDPIADDEPLLAAETMLQRIAKRREQGLRHHCFRAVLKSPSWYADAAAVMRRRDDLVKVVTAGEFMGSLSTV